MTSSDVPAAFQLGYVPGVTPEKWVRIWRQRRPKVPLTLIQVAATRAMELVRLREADAVLQRSPFDRTDLHAIPLYTETTVVVVPKDHLLTVADEVSIADLADELVFHPVDDTLDWEQPPGRPAIDRPASTADAVPLVAAGVGLLVVPQSLARLHHRRDLTYRTVQDAPVSQVALSWLAAETSELMEEFIGIVRGRTVRSTRGQQARADVAEQRELAAKKPARRGGRNQTSSHRRGKPRRR